MHKNDFISSETLKENLVELITNLNPEFGKLLESLDSTEKIPVLIAKYSYGDNIFTEGKLFFEQICDTKSKSIDNLVHFKGNFEELRSGKFCLGLVLDKTCESFIISKRRFVTPLNFYRKGDLILIPSQIDLKEEAYLDNKNLIITSGARSIFLLAKAMNINRYNKIIKSYNLNIAAPENIWEQWNFLRHITKREGTNYPWESKIMFIPRLEVLKKYCSNSDHNKIESFLNNQIKKKKEDLLKKHKIQKIIDDFLIFVNKYEINSNKIIFEHIKNLILQTYSLSPTYQIANHDEEIAPTKLIEYVYTDLYRLDDYIPILMYAEKIKERIPGYYSLSQNEINKHFNSKEIKNQLLYIMNSMNTFCPYFRERKKNYGISKEIKFDYFQSLNTEEPEIKHSKEIPNYDPKIKMLNYNQLKFPYNSDFVRNCIMITKNVDQNTNDH